MTAQFGKAVGNLKNIRRFYKNNAIVEMTLPEDNSQIFAGKYEKVLPSKEELQRLLTEHPGNENGGDEP